MYNEFTRRIENFSFSSRKTEPKKVNQQTFNFAKKNIDHLSVAILYLKSETNTISVINSENQYGVMV